MKGLWRFVKRDYLKSKKGLPSEVKKTIIIILVVAVLLVGMYFLTTAILSKDNEKEKITENAIQYDEILAGESFNQNGVYYVIYYDSTDEYSTISSLISSYQLNNTDTKLYSVDLSNGMNKKYITDGDIVTSDASSLRVKDNTLLKFNNGEVSEVITDTSEITNFLNS